MDQRTKLGMNPESSIPFVAPDSIYMDVVKRIPLTSKLIVLYND